MYFFCSHHLVYILFSIFAQSQASVPPAPAWISKIASFSSYSPFNNNFISRLSTSLLMLSISSSSNALVSSSFVIFISFNISKLLSILCFKFSASLIIFLFSFSSAITLALSLLLSQNPSSFVLFSSSFTFSFLFGKSK